MEESQKCPPTPVRDSICAGAGLRTLNNDGRQTEVTKGNGDYRVVDIPNRRAPCRR